MSRRILAVAGVAVFLSASASAQTYTTFTVPGAAATIPTGIDGDGTVTGYYNDGGDTPHGFVRAADGTITTFDPEGSIYTQPSAIDKNGTIVGTYATTGNVYHGFVRAPDGTFTTFDPKRSEDTFVTAVHGKTIGSYEIGSKIIGFERSRGGHISKIRFPDVKETNPMAINGMDEVTGNYRDRQRTLHGFFRGSDGTFTSFDPEGSTQTIPAGIARDATIVGNFDGTDGEHGFVRASDGTITPFDVSGATLTQPVAINTDDTVVGFYLDAVPTSHGFFRSSSGVISTFNVTDSTSTSAAAINNKGMVTGTYTTGSGGGGAYILTP